MLKKFSFQKIAITTLLLLLAIVLYNYPEEINEPIKQVEHGNMNIYLIDENDFVAMTEIQSNSSELEDKIYDIINSLIIGNQNSSLPSGFKAIIPSGTEIMDIDLKDGLLKVNFNDNFLNVSLENENKMIESLIFSLTTLKQVEKIMIFVNGERLSELPNSKKKLDLYLDRSYGINKIVDIDTFSESSMVTVYYLCKMSDYYYVPISYVLNNVNDKVEIIINSLKSNRLNNSNLLSHLDYQVELMNYESTEDEIFLDFNEVLLNSLYNDKLKEEVKLAISYSIYDTIGINNIVFMVNSSKIDEFRLEN